MKTLNFSLLAVLLYVLIPSLGYCQSAQELLNELSRSAREVKQIDGPKLQELLQLKRQIENDYNHLDQDMDHYKSEVEQYNSFCRGTYEESEYRRRLNICNSDGVRLDSERTNLQQRKNDIDRRDQERTREANKIYNRRQYLVQHINEIMVNLERLEKFKNANQRCANLKTLEEMSHCMQQLWDGAR
jgi:hypothetical protein